MGRPLHSFLEEFGGADSTSSADNVHRLRPRTMATPAAVPPTLSQIGDAYARGFEEGQSAGRAQLDATTARLHADYRAEIEAVKASFSQNVAADLARTLREQIGALEARIGEQVARALLPVLRHALSDAAVIELAQGISTLTQGAGAVAVEISGPQELVDRVWRCYCEEEARLGRGQPLPEVRFRVDDMAEVRISIGEAVIESQLMDWIGRLAQAVGACG